jgi:hypothetical protein
VITKDDLANLRSCPETQFYGSSSTNALK